MNNVFSGLGFLLDNCCMAFFDLDYCDAIGVSKNTFEYAVFKSDFGVKK